jgi:hypothetical protein
VIVMLAASPVTAPFSSCQASALLAAPASAAVGTSTAGLSIQPLAESRPAQQVSMAEEQSNDKVTLRSAVCVSDGPEASVRPLRSVPIVTGATRTVAAVLRL